MRETIRETEKIILVFPFWPNRWESQTIFRLSDEWRSNVAETSRRRSVEVMNVAVKTLPSSATTMDSTETGNAWVKSLSNSSFRKSFKKRGSFKNFFLINCPKKLPTRVQKSNEGTADWKKNRSLRFEKKMTNTEARAKLSEQKSANDVLKRFFNDC